MQQQVRLVFMGETLQGFDAAQVRRRVGRELGLDKSRLARLFSGKRIVLKRAVDPERAFRHVDRFAKVGARLRIEMLDAAESGLSVDPATGTGVPSTSTLSSRSSRSSRGSRRSSRSRRRAQWAMVLAFIGLMVGVGALAAWLLLPSDLVKQSPAARGTPRSAPPAAATAATAARPARPDPAALSAKAWPQLTGPAAQIWRDLYKPARNHKAFAAAPDGRWGWTADASTAAAAVDAARSACEVGRLPGAPPCEVLSVDGDDPPKASPPASPSSAPR